MRKVNKKVEDLSVDLFCYESFKRVKKREDKRNIGVKKGRRGQNIIFLRMAVHKKCIQIMGWGE